MKFGMINGGPKYLQLAGELRQRIALGEYAPESQLPTEWQLVERHGLSRGTVRQALTVLEQSGLIRREQGRGMFVNPPRTRLPSFTLAEPSEGVYAANLRTVCAETVNADATLAEKLGVLAETPVFHVVQVRYADTAPVMHEERFLAARWYPGLLDEEIGQTPMHWILVHRAKLPLVRMVHTIETRPSTPDEAVLLCIVPETPVFAIERLTYTQDGSETHPAVWYRALCRGNDFQLRAEFLSSV